MLGEFLRGSLHLEMLSDVLELFSLPSYFLAINVLSIVLCFRTFSEPPYLSGQGLTEHFTGRFGITPREREIIPLLVEGRTYAEVADSLYISYKTVDNHVQNIYQKTGVRNRLQLAHLLQANQAP
jgi:DNA-binding CsgD family transcriptional regulator